MCTAGVEKNEASFANHRLNGLKTELQLIQEKARFPVPLCYYFRMLPDHKGILNEDEVFTAPKATSSTFLVTMRFPTYFGSDLIKRRVVDLETIKSRCKDEEQFNFYCKLTNCILLSTKGSRSSADMMSGGDFDGDLAWVCFDKDLVDQIDNCAPTEIIPAPEKHHHQLEKAKDGEEGRLQMIKYVRKFKNHKNQLGILSITLDKALDKFGVDSEEAKFVARKSFLQVDHPYLLQEISREKLNQVYCDKPHWLQSMWKKQDGNNNLYYHSKNILGLIYDKIKGKLPDIVIGEGTRSHVISTYLTDEEEKAKTDERVKENISFLRDKMTKAVIKYNEDLYEKLLFCDKNTEESEEKRSWMEEKLEVWHKELFPNERDVNDCNLRAAILYDVCIEHAARNGREFPYTFAWEVTGNLYGDMYVREKRCRSQTSFSTEAMDAILTKRRRTKLFN